MELSIRPVTPENRREILALEVRETQKRFIETTAQCLEEADALSLWRPVGLYDGELLVGFAMYGLWKYEGRGGRVWLDRFLIDRRHQGRGYGQTALRALLAHIRREYGCREVYLSLYADNTVAARLYESFGFHYNGELDQHGERVMVLDFAASNGPPFHGIVRLAIDADRPAVCRLYQQFYSYNAQQAPAFYRSAEEAGAYPERVIRSATGDIFLAEHKGAAVGLLHVEEAETPPYACMIPHRYAEVVDLYVEPQNRGNGIGTALLHAAKDWAERRGLDYMELSVLEENPNARRFYERERFAAVSRTMRLPL